MAKDKLRGWRRLKAGLWVFLTFRWPRFPLTVGVSAGMLSSLALIFIPSPQWYLVGVMGYFLTYEIVRMFREGKANEKKPGA